MKCKLPSRQDIADYLGLTIETVSRTLTHFEEGGMIALSDVAPDSAARPRSITAAQQLIRKQ